MESFDPGKYGQFLKFCDNADVSEEHCQIECDASGNFWLRSLVSSIAYIILHENEIYLVYTNFDRVKQKLSSMGN